MKKIIGLLTLSISFFAQAAEVNAITPNQFQCTGFGRTSISYTTTSFAGNPTYTVVYKGQNVPFTGFPEVKVTQTIIGKLVGANYRNPQIADVPFQYFGLVIPNINFKTAQDKLVFDTIAIRSVLYSTGFVPHPFIGAAQGNDFIPVKCTATFVVF